MAGSKLESTFLFLWRVAQGPALEREVKFHPTRKWRADFGHLDRRTLIEIAGGIFLASGGPPPPGTGQTAVMASAWGWPAGSWNYMAAPPLLHHPPYAAHASHWPGRLTSNLPNRRYTASHKINACYDATTLAQQTASPPILKLRGMEVEQPQKENSKKMIEINIKEFLEAAQKYLFGLTPARQPALVAAQVHRVR